MRTAAALLAAALCPLAGVAAAENPVVVGKARFTVVAPECFRLEYSTTGVFIDTPSLLGYERGARDDAFTLARSSGQVVLESKSIRLVYRPDGKPFGPDNLSATVRGGGYASEWKPGMWSGKDLGGARNLDGVKGPAPMEQGLLSRDGWRLVDDSNKLLLKDQWAVPRGNPEQDWYLFGYGHDYHAALRALTKLSGSAPLPRRYALGSWYSRWWPHGAEDFKRIAREYREHGFPLDVLVVDMDWHAPASWTGYTWDKKLFPDPKAFFRWAHGEGLAVGLNDHPQGGVQAFEPFAGAFQKALGSGTSKTFDAGDRRYMLANLEYTHEPVEKQGLDFWWLDYWSDEKEHPLNRLQWLNQLYYERSREGGRRGMILSRWGDWGDHRHPMLFSGDAYISWPTLAFEVPFTADSGNTGAFFWSHDVGGYQGERNGELLARWTQFAAVSAAMRLHSMKEASLDKRPWTYGPDVEQAARAAFRLRAELMPYAYSTARQAHRDSLPLLRPLYLSLPEEPEAYVNPQEYMFGDALLAAPIAAPGKGSEHLASQTVWLPEGRWWDWFSGQETRGPSKGEVSEPLSRFPLFARGGVPIPLQPYADRPASAPLKTLVVRVYPGGAGAGGGAFELYEDDGLTERYTTGAFAVTILRYAQRGVVQRLEIGPQQGDFSGRVSRRSYRAEFGGLDWAGQAAVDGKPAQASYDPTRRLVSVEVPERDARKPVVVEVSP